MTLRMYADNVLLAIEPEVTTTPGGIHIPQDYEVRGKNDTMAKVVKLKKRGTRFAVVLASGPGHYKTRRVAGTGTLGPHTEEQGAFIPNETRPGMRVVIDAQAGDDYALDPTAPRHNLPVEFTELLGEVREFRVVREQQVLAVIG